MMQGHDMNDNISRESMYRRAAQLEEEAKEALKGANNPTEFIMWNAILGERTAFKHDIMDAKSTRPQWIMMSDMEPDTEEEGYYHVAVTSDAFSVDYRMTIDKWKRYPNGSYCWEGEVSKKHRVCAWAESPEKFDPYKVNMYSMPKENFQGRRNIGYWILCGNEDQDPEDVKNNNFRYTCSCCSATDVHASSQVVPYCWSCGTKMLGEAVMDMGQSTQDIIMKG